MTMPQAIHFGTAEMINNKTKTMIIKLLQQIINTYHRGGYRIKHNLADQQFECIRKTMELQVIDTNITGRDEHVPEVKGYTITVIERARENHQTITIRNTAPPVNCQNSIQCSNLTKLLPIQGQHTPYT